MLEYASSAENSAQVTVSIVSHGHGALVSSLLADLATHCGPGIAVILTLNIPEYLTVGDGAYPFQLKVIRNEAPKGFGANHNAAFRRAKGRFFCVLNPDIRLPADPFPTLLADLADVHAGVAAPQIRNPDGAIEDSARRFPTLLSILGKLTGPSRKIEYETSGAPFSPDWVAGMFLLFRAETFRRLGGFDESFFLYYEDVDLCARLRRAGFRIIVDPLAIAIHHARRTSRRNPRYAWWHLSSMSRYFVRRYLLNTY
jgi:N-acetylglucosaminyl-diphospho-decaprenol L-rhamnosyltransferase